MNRQASKDIVVAALITDSADRVLIVQPHHKEGWIFPGGYVEKGESPSAACAREVAAELGLTTNSPTRLLSIDYCDSSEEYVMFIFDCGIMSEEDKAKITLSPNLKEFTFAPNEESEKMLRRRSSRRLMPTLEARKMTGIAYLEHEERF